MLHGIYFINVMFGAKGIYSFQFRQVSKELICLCYIPDKVDRMMPGIFISVMLAITVSCLTQESLSPSPAVVPWLVHFLVIFGIWISYYRTQMAELNAMWETEYYEDDEETYDWQPEFQGGNYYY